MENFQVLVSTMNQNDDTILERMNLNSDAIIINQCNIDSVKKFKYKEYNIRWINTSSRGLSYSRNIGIDNSFSEIILFADDDLVYIDNYKEIIENEFNKNKDIDIIAFQVQGIEKEFKRYNNKKERVGFLKSMKISSVEIAIKSDSIKKYNLRFNEEFGSGAKYSMGEENIFLYECLKKDMRVITVPIKIADLHIESSTWFKGFNKKYLHDRGAIFTAMSKKFSVFLILQFAIRKRALYKERFSLREALLIMLEGRRDVLRGKFELE